MTKTTWTFLYELPIWSLKTCRTLFAVSANNRVVCMDIMDVIDVIDAMDVIDVMVVMDVMNVTEAGTLP